MMPKDLSKYDETWAFGRLPNLDIEIVHRISREGRDEFLTITMRAVPSFEALGRMLEVANPFLFWTRLMRSAWLPWMGLLGGSGVEKEVIRKP
jgi:hypothetical protein